jgi:riboflavin kinase
MSETTSQNVPASDVERTEVFRKERPQLVGPDAPEAPFPIHLSGDVQKGFGRGSKQLGCPTGVWNATYSTKSDSNTSTTANLPDESVLAMSNVTQTGVYYGYARISTSNGQDPIMEEDKGVFPMVMSLGVNPYYNNKSMTAVSLHLPHISSCLTKIRKSM